MTHRLLATSLGEWLPIPVAVVLGVTGLVAIWQISRRSRGTTLREVGWWAMASLGMLVGVEIGIVWTGGAALSPGVQLARYAAGVSTLCPMMALLGAKRPQDRAWQAIVLSLWAILLLPAVQWWLSPASSMLQVGGLWQWFLGGLLLVALANHLPTRFFFAALSALVGQTILLWRHLPFGSDVGDFFQTILVGHESVANPLMAGGGFPRSVETLLAVGLFVLGAWFVELPFRRQGSRRASSGEETLASLDRLWHDFRDLYGVVWSLRVMGFMNSYAERYGWPVVLTWQGFERLDRPCEKEGKALERTRGKAREMSDEPTTSDEPTMPHEPRTPVEIEAAVTKSFRVTLRRFVSPEWIAERVGTEDESENPND